MRNEQTRRKPQKTLEFKLAQPRKTFSSKPIRKLAFVSKWIPG